MEHLIGPIITGVIAAVGGVAVLWNKLTVILVKMKGIEKDVAYLKKCVEGNGDSLPVRCVKHSGELEEIRRRLTAVEEG
jgi:hypothetical protein